MIKFNKITRFNLSLALLLVVMLLTACGQAPKTDEESVALIQQYYQAQQSGELGAAAAMYPAAARMQWQAFLEQGVSDRGAVKQYVIESIEPNTVYSGKFYLATVRVTTGNGRESIEMVTALRKLSEDQTYIVSHKIKMLR